MPRMRDLRRPRLPGMVPAMGRMNLWLLLLCLAFIAGLLLLAALQHAVERVEPDAEPARTSEPGETGARGG